MSTNSSLELTNYYDAVPYDSQPFPQTAIEHLETMAFIFGLETPAPAKARVLELGCAAGGNLIPFAARFPEARAVGVDLSPVQIGQGLAAIDHAQLGNIDLRVHDIADIDASFGQFDYIVCHGVYSWVPGVVQDAILRICSENLAPNGVAYVSYNVYPGWKAREIVRDAMLLRGGPRQSPEEKLSYGRGMLEFLAESARPESVLKKALDETMPIIRGGRSAYLLHEFYEPWNSPCYFKQFLERAEVHGLAYLAESETSTMFVQNYAEKVRAPLLRECEGSQILMEQYTDFLVNRTFRQTLLVKQARSADIRYQLDAVRLRTLFFAGAYAPLDGSALTLDVREQQCSAPRNLTVTLRVPVHKAVAQLLDEHYPAALTVDALVTLAAERTGEPRAAVDALTMAMLEEMLILGAVRVRRAAPNVATVVSKLPQALPAVRRRLAGEPDAARSMSACTQWHEQALLTPLERSLLPLLDGAHTHEALRAHIVSEAKLDRLRFLKDGQPIVAAEVSPEFIGHELSLALGGLRRKGLLVA